MAMLQLQDGFKGERAVIIPSGVVAELENDIFCSQLFITDIGFYPNAKYHYRHREQGVAQYILICCVKGRGWIELEGQRYEISANRYFMIPANTPHAYSADAKDPWTIYWVHFKGNQAVSYYRKQSRPSIFVANYNSKTAGVVELLEDMIKTLQRGFNIENIRYATSCLHHFLGQLRYDYYRRPVTGHQTTIVEHTVRFMKDNISVTLTSEQLASKLGYSYSHLSAIFSKSLGCSPCGYFLILKMQQACYYLDFTDMKINQICCKVGIDDAYYFSRLFRKIIGVSPRVYRSQLKG